MRYYRIGDHIIDLDSIIHVQNLNWTICISYPNRTVDIKFDNHQKRNNEFNNLWLAIAARNKQM